jgi:hypothetical protein
VLETSISAGRDLDGDHACGRFSAGEVTFHDDT